MAERIIAAAAFPDTPELCPAAPLRPAPAVRPWGIDPGELLAALPALESLPADGGTGGGVGMGRAGIEPATLGLKVRAEPRQQTVLS